MPLDMTSLASQLAQAQMFPYFSLCHMTVCALNVKAELGTSAVYFSRKNPLACWLSNLLSMFSSQILANFLLNEPVIASLSNTRQVLAASFIWYCIYYSPFDVFYRLAQFTPFKLVIYCANEIYIANQIRAGINHANKVYPQCHVVMLIVGVVRGNGAGLMRILEALTRGTWNLSLLELMHPTYATKAAIATSLVFIANDAGESLPPSLCAHVSSVLRRLLWLPVDAGAVLGTETNQDSWTSSALSEHQQQQHHHQHLLLPGDLLMLCLVIVAIYIRVSALLLDLTDPFVPLENLLCLTLFGGIWDALARAIALDERRSFAASSSSATATLSSPSSSSAAVASQNEHGQPPPVQHYPHQHHSQSAVASRTGQKQYASPSTTSFEALSSGGGASAPR